MIACRSRGGGEPALPLGIQPASARSSCGRSIVKRGRKKLVVIKINSMMTSINTVGPLAT